MLIRMECERSGNGMLVWLADLVAKTHIISQFDIVVGLNVDFLYLFLLIRQTFSSLTRE